MVQLHRVLTSKWTEAESRKAELQRLEERVRAAVEYLEVLLANRERFDWLTAQLASSNLGPEQAKAERDIFATCICKLEAAYRQETRAHTFLGGPCGRARVL